MLKTIAAIILAAAIAGAITGFPQFIDPVAAGPAAADEVTAAPACPQRGWPYRHCGAEGTGQRGVRLIAIDWLR